MFLLAAGVAPKWAVLNVDFRQGVWFFGLDQIKDEPGYRGIIANGGLSEQEADPHVSDIIIQIAEIVLDHASEHGFAAKTGVSLLTGSIER